MSEKLSTPTVIEDCNKHRDISYQRSRFDQAVAIFKEQGGILRTAQALRAGIHPGTLYAMRDSGMLEVVSRGVYRLSGSSPLGNPDLVTVASRIPGGVICLISALAFHELTTQIPHEVHVALPRGAEEPRLDHPPIKTYRFTGKAFTEGIEIHKLDGVSVNIYNPEKTLADRFILKGALMFSAWNGPASRPTMDIDLLGSVDNSLEVIIDIMKDICATAVIEDGVTFDVKTVTASRIAEVAEFEGVRV